MASYDELVYYAAGIIDGEGSIGMRKVTHKNRPSSSYQMFIRVNMTDMGPIKVLYNLFGGNVTIDEARIAGYKAQGVWTITSQEDVKKCLESLVGKLTVKDRQALNLLQYIASIGRNERDNELREAFYTKAKELNK
jgi:hypothetical protein